MPHAARERSGAREQTDRQKQDKPPYFQELAQQGVAARQAPAKPNVDCRIVSEERQVVELLGDFDAGYSMIGNVGEEFYFRTDLDAPRERIICIDITEPSRAEWREVVPESEEILEGVSIMNNSESLILKY